MNIPKNITFKFFIFILIQLTIVFGFIFLERYQKHDLESISEFKLIYQNSILRENFNRAFLVVDDHIDYVKKVLTNSLSSTAWETLEGYDYLKETQENGKRGVSYATVYDRNGDIRGSSLEVVPPKSINVSDREYFKELKQGKQKVYFGPYIGRSSKVWTFATIRRLESYDNSFDGVLVGAISIEYFSSFCKDVQVDDGVQTFILNKESKIIFNCSNTSLNISNLGKNFFSQVINSELTILPPSQHTTRYETPNWLLFSSSLSNDSGISIVTLASKKVAYKQLSNFVFTNRVFLFYLILTCMLSILLYVNILVLSYSKRKGTHRSSRSDDLLTSILDDH